jgi:hypothetical protein
LKQPSNAITAIGLLGENGKGLFTYTRLEPSVAIIEYGSIDWVKSVEGWIEYIDSKSGELYSVRDSYFEERTE